MGKAKPDEKRIRRERARLARERELRRQARARLVRNAAVSVAVAAAVAGLGLAVVRGGSGGVAFAGDLRPGGTLERLSLPRLEGSGAIDYEQFADRPLGINFFASWCPNCIAEMPDFERVHQELGNEVAFLGISQSDSRDASIDLARQTGIRYPTAIDAQGAFFNAVGSSGMPTTLFVRPGGEIAYVQIGALDAGTLKDFIGRYLGVSA